MLFMQLLLRQTKQSMIFCSVAVPKECAWNPRHTSKTQAEDSLFVQRQYLVLMFNLNAT